MKSHCICGDAIAGSAELCGSEIMEASTSAAVGKLYHCLYQLSSILLLF